MKKFLLVITLLAFGALNIYSQGTDCATATPVSATGCSAVGAFNNTGVTGTLAAGSCWTAGTNNGMWFQFVASSPTANISINGGTLTQPQVMLIEPSAGCGGTFTEIGCASPGTATATVSSSSLVAGNTYFLYIDGRNNLVGTFQICISSPLPPANDSPCNPFVVPAQNFCSAAGAYTNIGGTAENLFSTGFPACWTLGTNNTVWFQYTATGVYNQISVTGTAGGIQPQVTVIQTGNCAGTAWTSNGASNCAAAASGNTVVMNANNLTIGQTYLVGVDGVNNTTGNFQLCINSYTPSAVPPNDLCGGAIALCPGMSYVGTTNGATNTGSINVGNWNCNGVLDNVVWYSFTASNPVQPVTFNINGVCTADALQFEVFRYNGGGSACSNTANWTSLGCNNSISPSGSAVLTIPAASMVAGTTYYVLIDNWPGSYCDFNFSVTGNAGANAGADQTVCLTAAPFNQTGLPAGGTWSGPGITNATTGNFNPASVGTGNYTVFYQVGNCIDQKVITVAGVNVTVSNDVSICSGQSTTLLGNLNPYPSSGPTTFTNGTSMPIPDNNATGVTSNVTVSGINPTTVGANPILSVCLNITHTWDSDLSIFLRCPGGTQIELSTGNGGAGDHYTNTCFVATGTAITAGTAPFNGNYTPEQAFTLLNACAVNGTWSLIVRDGAGGDVGTLLNWSITFNNTFTPTFVWSPTTNMTGSTTLNPVVSPTATTTYTLTGTNLGCSSSASVTVTVTPNATIAPGSNQTVCANTAMTNITMATTVATGATFSGLPPGVSGSWAGNVATISGTPTATGTYNYTVTTTGGCAPVSTTGTITVTASSTIAPGTNQTVCVNTPITNITLATTGATGATFSGLPAGVTGSWAANVATISGTPTASGTFNYTVTTTGGCSPANTSGTITVTAQNTIAAGTNQTVCINTALTNITLATTGATGATFAGLPAGITGSWSGNVATISGTPTASGTFNYTVTTTGGCPPATTAGTITVNPNNTIAPGTNQSVCVNSAMTTITLATTAATGATFAGLPAGVTGSWAGNVVTISGTPTASGTFNYTVTTTGGCPPATTTGTITVTAASTITPGSNQTVCINTAITNINMTTAGATGATFAGLPAGVTGSWAANVATISGTPTVSGTFNYTVTTTGGCSPVNTNGTITVNAQNTIAAGTSQSICINSAITNITLATTGATGATFSGLPAGVTGSWAANVVTISGTATASGTFNYTVTTTGGCPPATTTGTITVNPNNTIASGTNQTLCVNSAMTNITLATTGATGATFAGLPAGVTGSWVGNNATISGTPTASGTFNYTVTTTGGCPPATATGTITVTPTNTIAPGSNQTVCVNSAMTNITLATTGAAGATFSGLPAGVTGSWAGNVATISGTPTLAGTYNYTVTTTGGCPPASTTGVITVSASSTIAPGTNQTVCVNSAITNIALATGGATGATFSGLPAGVSGSWAGNVATLSGTPTASGTYNYTVTTTGNCLPASTNGTITVSPSNTIASGTNQTTCRNSAITAITLATTGATGATFAGLPSGVTGSWAGNVATISGTPTVSGTFNYTVTTTGGCPPATTTGTITVTPLNTIAVGTNQTVCINSAIANIALATTGATGAAFAGLPTGVTGSWAGNVATISGTPTVSGTFNYTVTTTGGCPPAATTGTITVNPANTIAAGTNQTVCRNSPITNVTMATTGATGATFAGLPTGVTGSWAGNVATISGTPTVSGTFNYTVTTTGGCPPATNTGTIVVNNGNTITSGTNQTVCINSAINNINLTTTGATGATFSGLPTGVTGSWAGNVATISGTPTVSGTFNYTVNTTGGCPPASTTGTITVIPGNTIAAGTSQSICMNAAITTISLATTGATGATFAGLPAGVYGSWSGNNATISGTPTVSGTFNYTVTTTGGCPPATASGTITINSLPNVSFDADLREGCAPLDVIFTNSTTSSSALSSCVWSMGDGTTINGCGPISYTYPNPGDYDVTLSTTDVNGCFNSLTLADYIYVEANPIANFSASQYSVSNLSAGTNIDLTNQSIGASSYVWNYSDGGGSVLTNPTYVIQTADEESFSITLIAISDLGCTDTVTRVITITEELIYYIPNAFTPDGDSHNNSFQPVFTSGYDPYNFTMLIFNRWGEIIFETHDVEFGWNGTYNGKLVQDGSYTWKIDFKSSVTDKKHTDTGHVTLIR